MEFYVAFISILFVLSSTICAVLYVLFQQSESELHDFKLMKEYNEEHIAILESEINRLVHNHMHDKPLFTD